MQAESGIPPYRKTSNSVEHSNVCEVKDSAGAMPTTLTCAHPSSCTDEGTAEEAATTRLDTKGDGSLFAQVPPSRSLSWHNLLFLAVCMTAAFGSASASNFAVTSISIELTTPSTTFVLFSSVARVLYWSWQGQLCWHQECCLC